MADFPDKPLNREEQYLSSIAGEDNAIPSCPASRKEAYLNAIDGRVADLQEDIDELKNNPDVVDIVATKADLDAYDTSKLTDKDIIRVLADETHGGDSTYYQWDKQNEEFDFIGATSSGDVKYLTADDYNWPTNSPDGIAPWLLDAGIYTVDKNAASSLKLYEHSGLSSYFGKSDFMYVAHSGNNCVYVLQKADDYKAYRFISNSGQLVNGFGGDILTSRAIVDNLTSTLTNAPLSANQGKALNDKIEDRVIQNAGAPTTSTVGTVGKLLEDTTNGKLYQCTAIDTTDPDNPSYTWDEIGGGGVTVVQTKGVSTTDVMSQKATTRLIFAPTPSDDTVLSEGRIAIGSNVKWTNDNNIGLGKLNTATSPSDQYSIFISPNGGVTNHSSARGRIFIGDTNYGNSVDFGNYSISIGSKATSTNTGGIALGAFSSTTQTGEMNIGTDVGHAGYSYNNTGYRKITGVHNGEGLHDCATVAQGNTLAASAPTTSTVGVLGQLYTDTTDMHTYQCTAISGDTYTWTQRW